MSPPPDQTDDNRDLAALGYRPVLNRTLGSFSAFAAGFSYISILTDLENSRVLEVTEDRTQAAADALWDTLGERQARPSQNLRTSFSLQNGRPTPGAGDTASRESIEYSWDQRCNAIEQNCGYYNKQLMRGVFTLDGVIGDSWTWSAYISHAQSRVPRLRLPVTSGRHRAAGTDTRRISSP